MKLRYNDLNTYFRRIFGCRVQKITIDAGFSCPNRDGAISTGGCIYCNIRGSGTGAYAKGLSVTHQLIQGKKALSKRYKAKKFIAYFQAFSNTYAPVGKLKRLYDEALEVDDVVGLSIGTRPDCVNEPVLELLQSYVKNYLVWIEYGLQSVHDSTLAYINRGHDFICFKNAVDHLLYVVKGTKLAKLYDAGRYRCLEQQEYVDLVCDFMERIPKDMVIQRLTGDPHPEELVAPMWSLKKTETLALIRDTMEKRDSWQGKLVL
jgi:radical SAM superfamily enzyme